MSHVVRHVLDNDLLLVLYSASAVQLLQCKTQYLIHLELWLQIAHSWLQDGSVHMSYE